MKADGETTASWIESNLGEVLTVIRGVSYKKQDASHQPGKGLLPIIRATNIQDHLVFDELVYVPKKYVSEEQMLRRGDIVVAASSGSRKIVGKAARLTSDWQGSFGAFCFGIRPKYGVDSRFVAWFLQTSEYRHRISELSAGVNINNLRAKHIEETPFRFPSLDQQRRIASEIEKQFTRLEAGVAAFRSIQTKLKRYRAAVLKAACEGHLRPSDKNTWKQLTLPQFSSKTPNSIRRGPFGSAIKKDFFVPEGYKVYQQQNAIYDDCSLGSYYIAADKFRELSSFEVKPDDLIISCSGTVGRIALVPKWAKPGIINQALLKLTLDQSIVLNSFFVIMFKHRVREVLIAGARGAAMQNIAGVAELKKFKWLVPPLPQQMRIVAEVERKLSVMEEMEEIVSANLQRATRLRQSILQKAFSGQLVAHID